MFLDTTFGSMSEVFASKMRSEGLSEAAIAALLQSYGELVRGNSGVIEEKDIDWHASPSARSESRGCSMCKLISLG